MVHDEIQKLIKDPKSDYYTVDQDEIQYVLEDGDEYRSRNTFKIPKTASWQYLKATQSKTTLRLLLTIPIDSIRVPAGFHCFSPLIHHVNFS